MMSKEQFVQHVFDHIEAIYQLVEAEMLDQGDSETECQRLFVINRLRDFEHSVNGIQITDIKKSD